MTTKEFTKECFLYLGKKDLADLKENLKARLKEDKELTSFTPEHMQDFRRGLAKVYNTLSVCDPIDDDHHENISEMMCILGDISTQQLIAEGKKNRETKEALLTVKKGITEVMQMSEGYTSQLTVQYKKKLKEDFFKVVANFASLIESSLESEKITEDEANNLLKDLPRDLPKTGEIE